MLSESRDPIQCPEEVRQTVPQDLGFLAEFWEDSPKEGC